MKNFPIAKARTFWATKIQKVLLYYYYYYYYYLRETERTCGRGRGRRRERLLSRLPTQGRTPPTTNTGLDLTMVRSQPEQKSKAGCLTSWVTQVPLKAFISATYCLYEARAITLYRWVNWNVTYSRSHSQLNRALRT